MLLFNQQVSSLNLTAFLNLLALYIVFFFFLTLKCDVSTYVFVTMSVNKCNEMTALTLQLIDLSIYKKRGQWMCSKMLRGSDV